MKSMFRENYIIQNFWQSFYGCSVQQLETPGITLLAHKTTHMKENEIYILEWKNGGIIISAPSEWRDEVSQVLGNNPIQVESILVEFMKNPEKHGPIVTGYQFNATTFSNVSPNVRKLSEDDQDTYEFFMKTCEKVDVDKIDMDFSNKFHTFFGYFHDGKLLSLGNYQREDEDDIVAHIGILTHPEGKGNGYATEIIKCMMNDIYENKYIPQWRFHIDNTSSQKLFEKFGFQEFLRSYTLVANN